MNNISYHFLSIYYVPGTRLSILHTLSHLILPKPDYLHFKQELRLREVGGVPKESHTASKRQNWETSSDLWDSQVVFFIP